MIESGQRTWLPRPWRTDRVAELGELSIHRLDKTSLLDVVHILSHEVAECDGDLRNVLTVATDIGQQHACDAA